MEPKSFGELLRFYRESYGDRAGLNRPGQPRIELKAQALINCLLEHGVRISAPSFSEIEKGVSLPREAQAFYDAVSICLALNPSESEALLLALSRDILTNRLSSETAHRVIDARYTDRAAKPQN
jgi:hypothetical protein